MSGTEAAGIRALAAALLEAMATSDLSTVESLCAEDVVVFGTDADEQWYYRTDLLGALDGMRDLGLEASWEGDLVVRGNVAAGNAIYKLPGGSRLPTRVSMVFRDGLLSHAHFSLPAVTTSAHAR